MTSAPRRHLLAIRGLARADVEEVLQAAAAHKTARRQTGRAKSTPLTGRTVTTVFFEDSTRTRSSFEIAAHALGADVLTFTAKGSSLSKGETLIDTVRNIDAMLPVAMVIRHGSSGTAALVAKHVRASVVNAGDGTHEHPSQALLDAFTLRERLGSLSGKKIVIVGDLLHSRVARSNLFCLRLLGAEVVFCGPPTLIPAGVEELGAKVENDLDRALEGTDAVMMLRMQLERQEKALVPSAREYARRFGLSVARASKLAAHAVVMHPGPLNRGVEIAPEVADAERSVILDQVENGVAVRMAIMEWCCA